MIFCPVGVVTKHGATDPSAALEWSHSAGQGEGSSSDAQAIV